MAGLPGIRKGEWPEGEGCFFLWELEKVGGCVTQQLPSCGWDTQEFLSVNMFISEENGTVATEAVQVGWGRTEAG